MTKKIYTKTGDKGETSLFGGLRLPKSHIRIEAYGTVDELNASVGSLLDHAEIGTQDIQLRAVQRRLFTIGSNLASDPSKEMITPDLLEEDILVLEQAIDSMSEELPTLKHFILPGGHPAVSACHMVRTISRRAERRVVALALQSQVDEMIIRYLNRLSDYVFMLGRWIANKNGIDEIKWVPRNRK
jgi:cob(I)alamin adenosyltransferase